MALKGVYMVIFLLIHYYNHLNFIPMQQISNKNPRSVSRPMIWITLAFHLALGAFLYLKTTAQEPVLADQVSQTETAARP
jgi:hypothetical protein